MVFTIRNNDGQYWGRGAWTRTQDDAVRYGPEGAKDMAELMAKRGHVVEVVDMVALVRKQVAGGVARRAALAAGATKAEWMAAYWAAFSVA